MDLHLVYIDSSNYYESVEERYAELPSKEVLEWNEQKCMEDTFLTNVGVVTSEGTLVGHAAYVSGPWDPILPAGYAEVSLNVAKEWENEGIGDWMLEEVEQVAHEDDTKALRMVIPEVHAKDIAWAKDRGFETKSHSRSAFLDVTSFDIQAYDALFDRLQTAGIEFTNLAAFQHEEERFWDLWWELTLDVPGMERISRPENDTLITRMKDVDQEGFILAVDGDTWVGLSMIVNENDDTYYNSMTGVARAYRGKGIASALKVKAIEYALAHGASGIRTHNDSTNAPMLAVNEKLGYAQKPGIYEIVKQLPSWSRDE